MSLTAEELKELADYVSRESMGRCFLFWKYGEQLLSTPQVYYHRSMPCTPAGDLVCNVYGCATLQTARKVFDLAWQEFQEPP